MADLDENAILQSPLFGVEHSIGVTKADRNENLILHISEVCDYVDTLLVNADQISLASRQLHTEFQEYRRNAALAVGPMNKLCRAAWEAAQAEQSGAKLIPMMLALVGNAVSRIDGRSISADRSQRWFGLLDQPILRTLDILVGNSSECAESDLVDLAAAYDQVRSEFSN